MPSQDEYEQTHLQRNKLRIKQWLPQIYLETDHGGFPSKAHGGWRGDVTEGGTSQHPHVLRQVVPKVILVTLGTVKDDKLNRFLPKQRMEDLEKEASFDS